jgi:hypothetical protein
MYYILDHSPVVAIDDPRQGWTLAWWSYVVLPLRPVDWPERMWAKS